MNSIAEIYMTPDQVAERLQVDPETVRRWLRAKKLRASRISAKAWRISERSLSEFMQERETERQPRQEPRSPQKTPRKPGFVEFLGNSPLANSGIIFERIKDSPRPIDL